MSGFISGIAVPLEELKIWLRMNLAFVSSSIVPFEELPKLLQMDTESVSSFISEYRCPF